MRWAADVLQIFAVFLVLTQALHLHSHQPRLSCFTSLHFNPSICVPNHLSISPAHVFFFFFYPSAPREFQLSQMMASEWCTCIYLLSELSYFSSLHLNITIIITSFTMRVALLAWNRLQKVHYLGRSGYIDASTLVLLVRKRAGVWRTHLFLLVFNLDKLHNIKRAIRIPMTRMRLRRLLSCCANIIHDYSSLLRPRLKRVLRVLLLGWKKWQIHRVFLKWEIWTGERVLISSWFPAN